MIENYQELTRQTAEILMNKTKLPDTSIMDIIIQYCEDNHSFDMEDFCEFILLEENSQLKEFIKQDLIKFEYVTDPCFTWLSLF